MKLIVRLLAILVILTILAMSFMGRHARAQLDKEWQRVKSTLGQNTPNPP
jgi:preprotein translocase subunit SecG